MMQMRTFYAWAGFLMLIALLGNLWNLSIIWASLTIGGKIAQIAGSILFNLLLAILFLGLWRATPKVVIPNNPELDKMLQSLSEKSVADDNLKNGRKLAKPKPA